MQQKTNAELPTKSKRRDARPVAKVTDALVKSPEFHPASSTPTEIPDFWVDEDNDDDFGDEMKAGR